MNERILQNSILAMLACALTFGTGALAAESKSSAPGGSAEKSDARGTVSSKPEAAKTAAHKNTHHNGTSHRASRPHHTHKASAASPEETGYRAALKNCAEESASERDGCLDSAIARFGRS